MVLQSIERLRTAVKWATDHPGPDIRWELEVASIAFNVTKTLDLDTQRCSYGSGSP